jgi:hypothetical protein
LTTTGVLLTAYSVLDINTQSGIKVCQEAKPRLLEHLPKSLVNKPSTVDEHGDIILRPLDRAIINFICNEQEELGNPIQIVRGAFPQGQRLLATSEIREQSHIQLAVRDLSCIEGYFLPKNLRP